MTATKRVVQQVGALAVSIVGIHFALSYAMSHYSNQSSNSSQSNTSSVPEVKEVLKKSTKAKPPSGHGVKWTEQ
jgi:hypothetical protein